MSYFDKCHIKFLDIRGEDMPDSEYFKYNAISNSKLKLIDPNSGGSPSLYKEGITFKNKSELDVGSAVHNIILQPNDYELSEYIGKPSGKLGLFVDQVFVYRRMGCSIHESFLKASIDADYYVNLLTKKRLQKAIKCGLDYYLRKLHGEFVTLNKEVIVLPERQLKTVKRCINSIKNCYNIQKIIKNNIFEPKQFYNEIALFSNLQVTLPTNETIILPIKGKLDSVVIDPETKTIYLNDIKTTSKSLENFMGKCVNNEVYEGSFEHHSYYIQLGLYAILLKMYCDYNLYLADYDMQTNIFAVETIGENNAMCFRINNAYIQYGMKKFKELICRVAYHEIYGYDKEIPTSN